MSKEYQELKPTTPASSSRYDSHRSVRPQSLTIAVRYGTYGVSRPAYLPPGLTTWTNSEGKLYSVYQSPAGRKFITEQSIHNEKLQERILAWATRVEETLKEKELVLPGSVEIYLDPSEDGETCWYYLADHESKAISWLEPVSSEVVGLRPAVSEEHAGYALGELYWNHLEYYSAHECGNIDLHMDALSSVIVQCQTDQLTSEDSTFPFSAQKCREFLRVIETCKGIETPDRARIRWSIARIWALVCNHRFMTCYGQENARLSRDQLIMDTAVAEEGKIFALQSCFLFNIPEHYNASFERLWADEIIYQCEWRDFIPKCRDEWVLSTALSFAVLICNLLVLNSLRGSRILSGISTAFSAAAVSAGTILLTKHQHSGTWTAAQAASYLTCARSGVSGFQRLACQFSLPRSLLLWALTAFSIQVPFLFCDMTDSYTLVILGTVAALCLIGWLFYMLLARCWAAIRSVRDWKIFQSRSISLDEILPY